MQNLPFKYIQKLQMDMYNLVYTFLFFGFIKLENKDHTILLNK